MPLTFASLVILPIYGKYAYIPYLQTFQRCAETAPREQKLGQCPEIPYYPETPHYLSQFFQERISRYSGWEIYILTYALLLL